MRSSNLFADGLAAVCLFAPPSQLAPLTHAELVSIVSIGDSITHGVTNRGADGGYSYRYWLYQDLIEAGVQVDMVGSQNAAHGGTGDPGWPDINGQPFDRDHQGHFGQATNFITDNLSTWLASYDADVALIHIGHNDGWRGLSINETEANITQIIQQLQADNANTIILLAQVVPSNPAQGPEGPSFPLAHINAVNALIPDIASATSTPTSPVHVVDLNTGFDPLTMIYDGVHPNALGEQFIADGFLAALETHVLPEPTTLTALLLAGIALSARKKA